MAEEGALRMWGLGMAAERGGDVDVLGWPT